MQLVNKFQHLSQFFFILCISNISIISTSYAFGLKTFVSPRSVTAQAARGLIGWQELIYNYPQEQELFFSFMPIYQRTFASEDINRYLFGADSLTFSGSLYSQRKSSDILADYFGLPIDFSSHVCFNPRITNFIANFDWFFPLTCVLPGLFIRIQLPVVNSNWNLALHECIVSTGTSLGFVPAGYFGDSIIPNSSLAQSVTDAFEGKTTFGDLREPLKNGKIFSRQTLNRVSDLQLNIGYIGLQEEWYHLGIIGRVCAPTGNRSHGEFLFESIIGNGHHWEVGGGVTAHASTGQQEWGKIGIWLEGYLTHLFSTDQHRSYDFINGPGSRYQLIEEFYSPTQGLLCGVIPQAATAQYQGRILQAINASTLKTRIRVPLQADIAAKLSITTMPTGCVTGAFSCDIGYDFWYRSAEQCVCRESFAQNYFAFKGDSQLYGFTAANLPVLLSATQSQATIQGGQAGGNFVGGQQFQNLNVDNAQPAFSSGAVPLNQLTQSDSINLGIPLAQILTSCNPVLITDSNINNESVLVPRALSHTLFAHLSFVYSGHLALEPFIGIGGSIEFAQMNSLKNSACSQWALWLKAGFGF